MSKIFVTGVSGAGKTTISSELEKQGINTISIDEAQGLCVWKNKINNEVVNHDVELNEDFIKSHNWICDKKSLIKLINSKEGSVVVLGSASNQDDFIDVFDKVLLLQCEPETFIKRIEKRINNDFGKDKSAQKLILDTYKRFEGRLIEKGAISIDANKPLEDVVRDILSYI